MLTPSQAVVYDLLKEEGLEATLDALAELYNDIADAAGDDAPEHVRAAREGVGQPYSALKERH